MKKLLIALFVCLPLTACNLFNSNPLIGKWKGEPQTYAGQELGGHIIEFTKDELISEKGAMKIDKYEVRDHAVTIYFQAAQGQGITYQMPDKDTLVSPKAPFIPSITMKRVD